MKLTLSILAASSLVALGAASCDRTGDARAAVAPAPAGSNAPGPSADTSSYKVEVKAVGSYKKGSEGTFEVVLATKADYHVNDEYPAKFKLAEKPTDVKYPKEKLERLKDGDAWSVEKCSSGKDNCTIKVKVPFTPNASGTVKVGGTLHVGVCNAATCLIEKQTLELSVTVS